MNFERTGTFATHTQLEEVTASYQLAYNTPMMAVLPDGIVPTPKEDFRDMAGLLYTSEAVDGDSLAIDPDTREFIHIIE